jgi:hypothetical protein
LLQSADGRGPLLGAAAHAPVGVGVARHVLHQALQQVAELLRQLEYFGPLWAVGTGFGQPVV